jgi:hypothetical protein
VETEQIRQVQRPLINRTILPCLSGEGGCQEIQDSLDQHRTALIQPIANCVTAAFAGMTERQ